MISGGKKMRDVPTQNIAFPSFRNARTRSLNPRVTSIINSRLVGFVNVKYLNVLCSSLVTSASNRTATGEFLQEIKHCNDRCDVH